MTTLYLIRFDSGESIAIGAADAKSNDTQDVRKAECAARRRAELRYLKRTGRKVRAVEVRRVG
jgi:hypothetical protein